MDVEIPELVPVDDYDARQARLESGMRWLLCKAHGGAVPQEYQEAFFSLGLSSVLASRLTSSELYWSAASAIFPEVKGQTQQRGHTPLIEFLMRRGVYLSDVNGTEVNEKSLQRASPIHLMSHMTLLEGLMTAYINNTLTPEKVLPALRNFVTLSASSELPTSAEDTAMFWVNKTCAALCRHLRELNASNCPHALTVNDIKDVNDGRCLAAVISFYCPQELPVSAIELGDCLAIADSLYNLQLLHDFCGHHLNASLQTLTVMDLFYTPQTLHLNILTFYADLFHCLEVERASCVRDTGQPLTFVTNTTESKHQKTEVLPLQPSSPQLSGVFIPQISHPTKRSFLRCASTNQTRPQSSSVNGSRQPLLPRRHSAALSANVGSSNARQSPAAEAWLPSNGNLANSLKGSVTVNASSGRSLLANVAIDDSIDLNSSVQSCGDNEESTLQTPNELALSKDVNRKRIVDVPKTLGPLQSSIIGGESCNSSSPSDPLLSAQLRPSKERSNNHSKKCEYSEKGGRKKHKAKTPDDNDCERSEPQDDGSDGSSSSSTPIDGYKTPSLESVENKGNETASKETAFDEDNSFTCASSNVDSEQLCRGRPGGQSYVVRGRPTIPDDAFAAGLPVAGLDGSLGIPRGITSENRSSNDGSDQELRKLRVDFRDKECKGRNGNEGFCVSLGSDSPRQPSNARKPLDKGFDNGRLASNDSKTSFAQIKKQKEAEEVLKGLEDVVSEATVGSLPKGVPLMARPSKKATFGALPNQTTWVQESAQRVSEKKTAASTNEDTVEPLPSELIGLRLKLEENRRQIENRKRLSERHWHQQRQQMGKEAFIQVITKNRNGSDAPGDEKSPANGEALENVDQNAMMVSRNARSKVNTLPKRQSPVFKTIQKPEDSLHDDTNQTRNHSSNDQSDGLQNVDGEICSETVRLDSSSQVRESAEGKEAISGVAGEEALTDALHSKTDIEDQLKYDDSLDRINSSLSVLQGEIQRLSRQQDQINDMVRSEVSQSARIATTSAQELHGVGRHRAPQSSRPAHAATTTPKKDEIFVRQFPSARETVPPGASPLPPMEAQNFLCTETPLRQSRPSAAPYSVPSYPDVGTPFPPRYHPPPSATLSISQYQQPYAAVSSVSMPTERMYSPMEAGHQFVAFGGQFHPSSGMYPMMPGMYPTSYGHYQGPVSHQQYPHLQNLSTLVPRPEFQTRAPSHGASFTEFSTQRSPFSSQPLPHSVPVSFQSHAGWPGPQLVQGQVQGDAQSSSFGPSEPQNPQTADIFSGQEHGINEGSDMRKLLENSQPSAQDIGDAGPTEAHPPSGGFFVNLGDSSTPTRQKPNLKARLTAKSKGGGDEALASDPMNSLPNSPSVRDLLSSPGFQTANESEYPVNTETGPMVFVIGQSTQNEDGWLEMERRKQRLCELQTKRQEEQDLRREKLQREQERMREQQRMKQELSEQKRAEEKARREAIFQTYLEKKKEKEMTEESPSKPVPPVIRRQRSAMQRAARPKSQPALPAEMAPNGGASGIVGHSSHDNLTMEGVASKIPTSNFSLSSEKVSSKQSEVPLAFGGLTHRRLSSPDQSNRVTHPTSDGSESSGSQMADNYTGPKLFVKPSQKSNRHIIINAISHCCLAGSVNRDVKDKALEEIAKSDSKHFIILFRDAAMQYRGLYTYNPEHEEFFRIHGVGPKQLTDKVMEKFYKYNSGSKKFSEVTSTKHFTATIDAITVFSTIWQKTRPAAPSKKPV